MEHFLANWGYLALFAATFVSSMGIPVGSEIAIAYGGVLASGAVTNPGDHHFSLALVIVVAVLGELLGSSAGYALGYFGGRTLVDRVGKYILLSHQDLDRAEAWFARRGEIVAFVGRLIPVLRSFVSFAAGLAEMRLVPFAVATVAGCVVWCTALASLGYSLGSSWHHVLQKFSYAGYAAAGLAVLLVALAMGHRIRSIRSQKSPGAHSPEGRRRAGRTMEGSGRGKID